MKPFIQPNIRALPIVEPSNYGMFADYEFVPAEKSVLAQELFSAIKEGAEKRAIDAVKKGAPLDCVPNVYESNASYSPICLALQSGFLDLVAEMLKQEPYLGGLVIPRVNHKTIFTAAIQKSFSDKEEQVLLDMLALASKQGLAEAILREPVGLNNGDHPVAYAAKENFAKLLDAILNIAPDLRRARGSRNLKPLEIAIDYGQDLSAACLISKTPDSELKGDETHFLEETFRKNLYRTAVSMLSKNPSTVGEAVNFFSSSTETRFYNINKEPMQQFAALVLFPALLLEAGIKDYDDIPHARQEGLVKYQLTHLAQDMLAPVPQPFKVDREKIEFSWIQQFLRPISLSNAWHHAANTFPPDLRPERPKREWHSLLTEDFTASNGCKIVCLNNSHQLETESNGDADHEGLDHCVGRADYEERCSDHGSHILSVRDASGKRLSTIEVTLDAHQQPRKKQHYGERNSEPPQDAVTAWEDFLASAKSKDGRAKIQTQHRGEIIKELKEGEQPVPELIRTIGYWPSWERVNECFNAYKNPLRRACVEIKDRKMIYENQSDELAAPKQDRIENHFIDGFAVVKQTGITKTPTSHPTGEWYFFKEDAEQKAQSKEKCDVYALRNMDIKSWLYATGTMEKLHQIIRDEWPEMAKQREDIWRQEAEKAVIVRDKPRKHIPQGVERQHQGHVDRDAGRDVA